jgi:hypothetical protein
MTGSEILETFKNLGKSQGFYSFLYKTCVENPKVLEELENKNFKDTVDLIMYVEL